MREYVADLLVLCGIGSIILVGWSVSQAWGMSAIAIALIGIGLLISRRPC